MGRVFLFPSSIEAFNDAHAIHTGKGRPCRTVQSVSLLISPNTRTGQQRVEKMGVTGEDLFERWM